MNIDVSNEDPPIESSLEGVRVVLRQQNGMPVAGQVSLRTIFTKDGRAVIEDSQRELCLADLLTVGLTEGSGSTSVLVRPVRSSVLYKLEKLRKGLQLEQTNPAFAARSTVHFPKIVRFPFIHWRGGSRHRETADFSSSSEPRGRAGYNFWPCEAYEK